MLPYELTDLEQDLYEQVTTYVREGMNRAAKLDGKRRNTVGFALTVLQRRLASSPEAIYRSLERRAARLERRKQEVLAGGTIAEPKAADVIGAIDEFDDDEFSAGEMEEFEAELVDAATAARTVEELGKQLDAIEQNSERWSDFVGGDLAAKLEAVRDSIRTADAAERQADAARVTATEPSKERIEEFRESSWTAFVESNPLRTRLQDAGALEIESTADAFADARFGQFLDKRLFIGPARAVAGPDLGGLGRAAAEREQVWLYEQLAEYSVGREPGDDAAAAALDAIARFREDGLSPDVILMPNTWSVRAAVAHHPAFEWSQRTRHTRPTELGKLDGIPVLDIGPRDANDLLVADLAKSVHVHERARPDADKPLCVEVRPIDAARAAELIDAGRFQLVEGQTREQLISEIKTWRVEVFVDLDYYLSHVDVRRAVVSIALR